VGWQPAYES